MTTRRREPGSISRNASRTRGSGGLYGLRQRLISEGLATCGTHHGRSRCRPSSRAQPSLIFPPWRPDSPAVFQDCRGRLSIGFQIAGGQLQSTVEVACQTDRTQVLTTIGWPGLIDRVSHRVLAAVLRSASHGGPPVLLPVFAAAARDLFRHASRTLAPHPAVQGPGNPFIAEAGPLYGDLLAAIQVLRKGARLRPRVTVTDRAQTNRLMNETLSALQELNALHGSYLEQALHPLQPHISPQAVRAFIVETRNELDDLAAVHTASGNYVETLSISEPRDNAVSLEVSASVGGSAPAGSTPDATPQLW